MKTDQAILETQQLLQVILDYCDKNGLEFWGESTPSFFKMFVADAESFETHQKSAHVYSNIQKIKKNDISSLNFHFSKSSRNDYPNCTISAGNSWQQENPKEHAELLVHIFWNCSPAIAKEFAERWIVEHQFNFSHALNYKNKDFPKGFSDQNIYPYHTNKNWGHFLDILPDTCMSAFWEKQSSVEEFKQTLLNIEVDGLNVHSFLRSFIEGGAKAGFNENSRLHASYFLMDVLPVDLHAYYANYFPFMKTLIENKSKDTFFVQDNGEIVEKMTLQKHQIFDYFNYAELSATQFIRISETLLYTLARNKELKENGLNLLEIFLSEDIYCYLNLKDNKVVNKHTLSKIFVETMTNCLKNKEVLLDATPSPLDEYNQPYIDKIVDITVAKFLLNTQIPDKNTQEKRRNKL